MANTIEDVVWRARDVMKGYDGRWWIAGGWAIDGWLGTVTRDHHDMDLAVLREDLHLLWRHFRGWTIWINEPGRFVPWNGGPLQDNDACFMTRPDDGVDLEWAAFAKHPDNVELMVEDNDGDSWLYRRDRRLRDHIRRLGPASSFLTPEVALLYKAPQADEERNRLDFEAALPHLDDDQRRWLTTALTHSHPGHPWVAALRP